MPLREDLLNPIAGGNPAGTDLRYDPVFDRIKEARREDDDAPQGDWQRERKVADFVQVTKLASDVLATKSKDLQIAAWLTEAQLRREGFAGLRAALGLLRGMLERFWDQLYPEPEGGDLELRAAPLDWVGSRLEMAVKSVPLTRAGHDFIAYKASRSIPTEEDAGNDSTKAEVRAQAIADGKVTPEAVEQGFTSTPKAWYRTLRADMEGCLEELGSLDEVSQERFGGDAPSFAKLRTALEEVLHLAKQLLARKLQLDPDPVEPGAVAAPAAEDSGDAPSGSVEPASERRTVGVEPVDREDAAARITGAARFLRRVNPRDPAPYLLLRGFRWGELRATGRNPDPKLLDAPATAVRTRLKSLLLDHRWAELLETAEGVMGTPQGRGWIDLQRYALTACERLGMEFQPVTEAIRGALRSLLADLPMLTQMTLMDDTPTANAETLAWLRDTVLPEAGADGASSNGSDTNRRAERIIYEDGARGREAHERALAEMRGGRPEKAIEILMRELDNEKSRRGRFLRQSQLADVMVSAGLESIAKPILEDMIAQIEAHKLDDWETGALVAHPLALLYRCLDKLDDDGVAKQALYLRICRLDPVQAIGFGSQR
jgi:type VI secretion system protein ImpA